LRPRETAGKQVNLVPTADSVNFTFPLSSFNEDYFWYFTREIRGRKCSSIEVLIFSAPPPCKALDDHEKTMLVSTTCEQMLSEAISIRTIEQFKQTALCNK
jgi:hypothetical protein